MNNFYRILPGIIGKKDLIDALQLAVSLSKLTQDREITLLTCHSLDLLAYFDGMLTKSMMNDLILGKLVTYDDIHFRYSPPTQMDRNHCVILALNCLPDEYLLSTNHYGYQVVLASASPDVYALPYDYWIRDVSPARF